MKDTLLSQKMIRKLVYIKIIIIGKSPVKIFQLNPIFKSVIPIDYIDLLH